jgi:hypothetical protein
MEVDEEIGTGGAISQNLCELSLDGNDTPVVVETEKSPTKAPLGRQSSQELIGSEDIQFTRKKLQVCVEVPPMPDYARQNRGKERAPIQEEDEEGLYGASVWRAWSLTLHFLDAELQAVVDSAFSRLRPTRCLWLGCKATLNSVDNLVKHLKTHADEIEVRVYHIY